MLHRTELNGKDLCMMSPRVIRDLMDVDDDDNNQAYPHHSLPYTTVNLGIEILELDLSIKT